MTEVNVSDSSRSKEELIEELASLQQTVAELQAKKIAFDTLHELLLTSITTVKTANAPNRFTTDFKNCHPANQRW
jgi:hypothetical protein